MQDGHVSPTSPVTEILVEHRRRFLSFLEARVESKAVAEEILQDAFVKSLQKGSQVRDEESAVAWFYRVLRNAIVDHYRHRGAETRALAKETQELLTREHSVDAEMEQTICACIGVLIPTLKDEYGAILQRVDLDGQSIGAFAEERGLTVGNARVRLHRARKALRERLVQSCAICATHGCFDCTCDGAPGCA